ncbi:hypothetical protein EUGRSUZ_B02253 [Eucalyptus grandis]|uniref:Carbohydrate kinase PfkB domain-containing protein n=2 Tax=Eucalyptus grandis TaxID=71139 RepID=A0A059D4Y6_EUCGR|nr:hypothetical protein EUGRSUZ_B02253 [Eucalyptus grandis]
MVRDSAKPPQPPAPRRGLVAGNYCHDVLFRDGAAVAESLGGAVSFIAAVLDGLSIPFDLVSKVGRDFKYATARRPIAAPDRETTLFHAYFDSGSGEEDGREDRVLKRVCSCDPIAPSDLPEGKFDFGMAVGVGGEILVETLERMIEICEVVLVDIQALIRVFDGVDGTVRLVELKESGFYHLLPRIGFIKASSEEVAYMDVEEVRNWCCVVVTNGKNGCTLYWRDGEMKIEPFVASEVDPTGAGDSFLGGLVAGLVQGLTVPDAALLGNFFGSLTVAQVGLPKYELRLLQGVKDEVERQKMQCVHSLNGINIEPKFLKPAGHDQFHASLSALKLQFKYPIHDCPRELSSPGKGTEHSSALSA